MLIPLEYFWLNNKNALVKFLHKKVITTNVNKTLNITTYVSLHFGYVAECNLIIKKLNIILCFIQVYYNNYFILNISILYLISLYITASSEDRLFLFFKIKFPKKTVCRLCKWKINFQLNHVSVSSRCLTEKILTLDLIKILMANA